jgi:MYXO-CTERM domain-containing protein
MKDHRFFRAARNAALALLATGAVSVAQAGLIGPSPYLSTADSPIFSAPGYTYFHLEDFEDHLLNTPGVTASTGSATSIGYGPELHDSVDADDGSIDGNGLSGDSFFTVGQSFTFTFNAGILGGLPSAAGLVWTDGQGTITFEAFDASNHSLGILTGNYADGSFNGGTAEDRFFGIIHAGGISSMRISSSIVGIEIDHLQYGLQSPVSSVPEPATLTLFGLGLLALRRRRT